MPRNSFMFSAAIVTLVVLCVPYGGLAFSGSGSGTSGDPYQITDCIQLQEMRDSLDASYVLENDIDCSATSGWNGGAGFLPVGDDVSVDFSGDFDGKGHVIRNLFINANSNYAGLFGNVDYAGNIRNIGMVNADVTGNSYTGSLAGSSTGIINNTYCLNCQINGENYVGGLAGYNTREIWNSYAVATVGGSQEIGGMLGRNFYANIYNCFSNATITSGSETGGLVGDNTQYPGTVYNSYWNNHGGNPSHCYNGGDYGCTAVSDNESYFSYENEEPMASWDFSSIWTSDGGYPELLWQGYEYLSDCATLSTPNGKYALSGSITNSSLSGPCINITAENVTLDCQWNSISSTSNVQGIYSNQKGTIIRNCIIDMGSSEPGYGIDLNGANYSRVTNAILNNQYRGLRLYYTSHSVIDNVTADSNVEGIRLEQSTYNILNESTANSNSINGITLSYAYYNTIINTTGSSNGENGIELRDSTYNVVNSSVFNSNQNNGGIQLIRASYNNISDTLSIGNDNYGIWMWEPSSNNRFYNVTATSTIGYKRGLYLRDECDNNVFVNCDFTDAGHDYDVFVWDGSNSNDLINCTYSLAREYVSGYSDIERRWHYMARVTDGEGNPLSGAYVLVYDKNENLAENLTAGASGWAKGSITEYMSDGIRTYYSPYTITTSYGGIAGYHHDYDVGTIGNLVDDSLIVDFPMVDFDSSTTPAGNRLDDYIFANISASDSGNVSTFIDFDNSLVSWWRMDDVSGSTVIDYMNRNNGTAIGGASQTYNGYFGKGFHFDGDGDYINCGSDNSLSSTEFTLSHWVKGDYVPSGDAIEQTIKKLAVAGGDISNYEFNWDHTRSDFRQSIGFYSSGWRKTQITGTLSADTWYHIAATYDGSDLKIYVNGILNNSAYIGTAPQTGPGDLWIGSGGCGGSRNDFSGIIDDVMIFNRSLSPAEIRALYANTSSRHLTHNFTGLSLGRHRLRAYAQDTAGNVNSTDERVVAVTGVDECQTLDTENITYTLQSDLNTSGDCLVVEANNVTIDLNGYNISGGDSTGIGINVNGYNETTIKNGEIYGFLFGVLLFSSSNNILTNITTSSNNYGIHLISSSNNILTNITTSSNGRHGIYVYTDSSNNEFSDFKISNCSTDGDYSCIYLYSGNSGVVNGNVFENGYISDSDNYGIHVYGYDGTYKVDDNVFKDIVMENIANTTHNVYLEGYAENNTFLNVSYSGGEVVESNSELIKKWYLVVQVKDKNERPVPNVNVTLFVDSAYYDDSLTNTRGNSKMFEVISYVNDGGSPIGYSYVIQVNSSLLDSPVTRTVSVSSNDIQIFSVDSQHTIQFILNVSASDSVFVPGTGVIPTTAIDRESYFPPYWYVASYLGKALKALVTAGGRPDRVQTANSSDSWCWGADTNKDGDVSPTDVQVLIANWGRSDCGTPSWCNGADVNNDGTVDDIDINIMLAQWLNESCHLNAKNIIMSQRIKGSKVLLAFVSGTTLDIDNRMQSIGSGRFLGLASPTFASGLGATHVVKVLLNYTGMDVVSDLILQEGRHNLMIENTGKSGGRQMIKVRSL